MANTVLLVLIIMYMIGMVILGALDSRKAKTFKEYAVAGKNQNTYKVCMTTLATIVGASATIGVVDTTYKIGFPGMWWLVFGAIGLILQALLISKKVRRLDADTLPDMARILVGRNAEVLISLIIVISWVGVVAGQLVALNNIMSLVLGSNSKKIFVLVSIAVLIYTILGGQMSVVKTDAIQYVIIAVGIVATFIYLIFVNKSNVGMITDNIELINDGYKPINLLTQFFIIGGVYFLGPDIMSRNLIAKDERTAKKSALFAAAGLLIFTVFIVFIGMWARYNVLPEEFGKSSLLIYVIEHYLPKPVAYIMVIAIISAILSSTDTCIINASSIFVKDILKKDSIKLIRITVLVIGAFAMGIALKGQDIITILTGAYSIYTPGVIFPLFIAIVVYKHREIIKALWLSAVLFGGLFGIVGKYFPQLLKGLPEFVKNNFSLIGMGVSLVLALISVKWKSVKKVEE